MIKVWEIPENLSEPAEVIHARIREQSSLIQKHIKSYKLWIHFNSQAMKAPSSFHSYYHIFTACLCNL